MSNKSIKNTKFYFEKNRITYDMWLQMYKGRDVNTVTLEQHTAYRKQYDAWKIGNIEKV